MAKYEYSMSATVKMTPEMFVRVAASMEAGEMKMGAGTYVVGIGGDEHNSSALTSAFARTWLSDREPGESARVQRRRIGTGIDGWQPHRAYVVGSDGIVRRTDR